MTGLEKKALDGASARYLDLLKKALTASLYDESAWLVVNSDSSWKNAVMRLLARRSLFLVKRQKFNAAAREAGEDWPMFGFTMAGTKRLGNVEECVASVIREGVPGDFVECGVWRGGSSIFARAALDSYGGADRVVWLADSFEGMPARTSDDMADPELKGSAYLEASLEDVQANFARFGLLDDRVKFVKGWFCDTLPTAPIKTISVLRLDGDYYSSTMDALNALYEKVSVGGYVIIDDYNAFASCKAAVTEFHERLGIRPTLHPIDANAIYWRREA
jgi:O-methyltransferase